MLGHINEKYDSKTDLSPISRGIGRLSTHAFVESFVRPYHNALLYAFTHY